MLSGGRWLLDDLAPHVTIKLKRWFPRIDVAATKLSLSATPENSEELAWFLERFPLRIAPVDQAALDRLSDAQRETRARIQLALTGSYDRPVLPMAKPPRLYQDQAAELCDQTGGLLCADDLGLGKTVTAIAWLARAGKLPAVVVVPLNVIEQWARKLAEFLPSARVYVVRSSPEGESKRRNAERAAADVILIAYSRISAWSSVLEPRGLVFDEVHELRRQDSNKYIGAQELRAKAVGCMGLSATPIFNFGGEFFNVLGVVRPGVLGERDEFVREWCSGATDKLRIKNPVAFGAWLREQGVMLRRSRSDVGRELPPIVRSIVEVPISGDCEGLDAIAWQALHGRPKDRFRARGDLDHRLRQWTGVAKAPAVAEFVDELIETTGEPVLLSGWHHAVYDIWRSKLQRWRPVFYTGIENVVEKDAAVRALTSGESKLLIMSLRSGQGLDGLQGVCHRVVHGELDWSPLVHEQLTGRVHRDGQGEPTMEYWLHATEGSDPVVLDTLGVKRWQSDGVLDPAGERALSVRSDPDAIRKLAEQYLRRRGFDPATPPTQTEVTDDA
jgi:SNF2 family DNA or RNA helicase